MEVHGDLGNIRRPLLEQLQALYDLSVPASQLSTHELNRRMLDITAALGREVAVYINRQGRISAVSVGDTGTVDLPEFRARSEHRLSGIRCVHTHPSGDTVLSDPDLSSLRHMRFDVMAAIGRDGKDIIGSMGFLAGELQPDGTPEVQCFGPASESDLHRVNMVRLITIINKKLGRHAMKETRTTEERAILAGIETGGSLSAKSSMEELARLA
ncbi:MAG: GTPase HflX, partial [Selenomonadaceae bacterium]|nr:GTPase HflX [Selenomonadaceae bacterium]